MTCGKFFRRFFQKATAHPTRGALVALRRGRNTSVVRSATEGECQAFGLAGGTAQVGGSPKCDRNKKRPICTMHIRTQIARYHLIYICQRQISLLCYNGTTVASYLQYCFQMRRSRTTSTATLIGSHRPPTLCKGHTIYYSRSKRLIKLHYIITNKNMLVNDFSKKFSGTTPENLILRFI